MPAEVRQQFLKIHLDKIEKKKRSIALQEVNIRTSSKPARSPVSVALGMLRRSAAGPIFFRISLGIVGLTVGRFGVNAAVWHSSPELLLEGEAVSSSSRLEGLPLSSPPPHSQ